MKEVVVCLIIVLVDLYALLFVGVYYEKADYKELSSRIDAIERSHQQPR